MAVPRQALPPSTTVLPSERSRAARIAGGGTTGNERLTAATGLALAGALTARVVLAVLVIPEFGPWVHGSGRFHDHHG
jgi:hypothetical protein